MTKNEENWIVSLNTVVLTKVNVKSINDVALPEISSNKMRVDAIR